MDQEELIIVLNQKHYSFKMVGDTIFVDQPGHVNLDDLDTLPENIKFVNSGYVSLTTLSELPKNIKFENNGEVYLKPGLCKHGHYKHPN